MSCLVPLDYINTSEKWQIMYISGLLTLVLAINILYCCVTCQVPLSLFVYCFLSLLVSTCSYFQLISIFVKRLIHFHID